MTTGTAGPLSRPVAVHRLPSEGSELVIEATQEEREALARDFGLAAIESLVGRFRIAGSTARVTVSGHVEAEIVQTCVVTLETFPSRVEEEVDVDFSAAEAFRDTSAEDAEMPDAIVDGMIDLGGLTAEFLSLGLDPYPRKPDASFAFEDEGADALKPFAALKSLREKP